MVEPWLRGTLTEYDSVRRQVLHALELAGEDIERWCAPLSDAAMNAHPANIAPVAFHLRHIARSLDRLLTYAEGRELSPGQLVQLQTELSSNALAAEILVEARAGLRSAAERVKAFNPAIYEQPRFVGRGRIPTTAAALLIHCAEHTQRHVGQAITTARITSSSLATRSEET
jgi:uncharacterized damage-inducible protein DinB